VTDVGRVALAARVFTIAALTSLSVLSGRPYVAGSLLVLLVAMVAVLTSLTGWLSQSTVAILEGACVAALTVVLFPQQDTVAPYLVIPVLIGAVDAGRRGLGQVLVAELCVMVALWALLIGSWDRAFAAAGFTWLLTAVGIGYMGTALRRATQEDVDASYRTAVALIRRLESLSGRLRSGLDAVDIAEQIMIEADRLLPTRHAGVYATSTEHPPVPLRFATGTTAGSMAWAGSMAEKCLSTRDLVVHERQAAIPLRVDDEIPAVLVLDALRMVDPKLGGQLLAQLRPQSLQLQAALLFGRVREAATSQERQRIAREVHDGVAQDVASLGYLVDNLAAGSEDPVQQGQIVQLRGELTRVVTELRHSIFDLRQVVPAEAGLGEGLSAYARQVGSTSDLTVHVTLDEHGPRLRPEEEHELLRIAQEAIANAVKHGRPTTIVVSLVEADGRLVLRIRDDGTGFDSEGVLSTPRGHFGLLGMRERARRMGGEVSVASATGQGTTVEAWVPLT
jgi:signal transduction histidine kinase